MPAATYPPPVVTDAIMQKVKYAERPGRFPKGFFDPILTPTRLLLDKGLRLPQAIDFLIEHGAMAPQLRRASMTALRSRLTRFRAREAKTGEAFTWKAALGYDAVHAIGGGTVALCGAKAGRWMDSGHGQRRCTQCKHAISEQGLTVAE